MAAERTFRGRQGHAQQLACLALALTAIALLIPGPVIMAVQSLIEPVVDMLRDWKNSWWPWPVAETTGSSIAIDKIVHVFLFLTCALLANRAWEPALNKPVIVLILLIFGATTEWLQYYIPGRGMSLGDMVANAFDIVAGITTWQLYLHRKR